MRPVLSRRALVLVCSLGVIAAACAQPTASEVDLGDGRRFVPLVVEFLDDAGADPSIAIDSNGIPYVVSFSFVKELEAGELPVQRPIGAPSLPAVSVATISGGIWTRGAAAMLEEIANVEVAFGPQILEELATATPTNVNGTAVAVDDQGKLHVAWAADTGLWYGTNAGGSFAVEQVVVLQEPLTTAGPLGAPGIAVDGSGSPAVAYTLNEGESQAVTLARPGEKGWESASVAEIARCSSCPQPDRTAVGFDAAGEPFVAYVDTAAGSPMFARLGPKDSWSTAPVETGGGGAGLSMAVDGDGNAHVAYFAAGGSEVHVASSSGGGWFVGTAATLGEGEGTGTATTSVTVDDQGTEYVAWYDRASEAIGLASGSGSSFAPVQTQGTEGGDSPAVGVAPDGSTVYLAWYDRENGDLLLGALGDTEGLALAMPSPTGGPGTETAAPPTGPPAAACEPEGTELEIVAPAGAAVSGFDTDCLAAPAGEDLTIGFDNQDAGVQHNVAIHETDPLADPAAAKLFVGELIAGPDSIDYEVKALDEGVFFFRCDVHPTTMTGTFVSAVAKTK